MDNDKTVFAETELDHLIAGIKEQDIIIEGQENRIDDQANMISSIARAINYPDCWDTTAYPTLLDAIKEMGRNVSDCLLIQDT